MGSGNNNKKDIVKGVQECMAMKQKKLCIMCSELICGDHTALVMLVFHVLMKSNFFVFLPIYTNEFLFIFLSSPYVWLIKQQPYV